MSSSETPSEVRTEGTPAVSRNLTREKYEFAVQHPHPGEDPIARLRHTLDLFAGQPDDEFAILATSNAYPDGGQTGLTWGDLRAIAGMVDSPDVQSHGNARVCTNCYAALPELFDGFPSTYCQHRRPEVDQPVRTIDPHCPAAHAEDPSPCDGPSDAIRIVDRIGAETQGCIPVSAEDRQVLYVAMVCDRHTDPEPFVFSTAEAAVAYAQQVMRDSGCHPDFIAEREPPNGRLFFGTWSSEDDAVWVLERQVDQP